ncbi:hypothetical protein LJC24_05300 [Desulfococcaceae bacterium OttesenSCG-928-F15]|nr:hypothetical protein [Desulfococcaceae bacterium OttesenSCG-928-F15]
MEDSPDFHWMGDFFLKLSERDFLAQRMSSVTPGRGKSYGLEKKRQGVFAPCRHEDNILIL